MPKFSGYSLTNLRQAVPDLQRLFRQVVETADCMVDCGYRGEKAQEEVFNKGYSKAHFGSSPHNYLPSYAVDCIPYPSKYSNEDKLVEFANYVKIVAIDLGIDVVWGGDWSGNYGFKRHGDLPHWEISGWKKLVK